MNLIKLVKAIVYPMLVISLINISVVAKPFPTYLEVAKVAEKENVQALEAITIEKAIIKNVDITNNRVTILPDGKENELGNYIILNIGEQTIIKDKCDHPHTLEDLKERMCIKVIHSPIMQPSYPPQTGAFQIIIL